MEESLLFLLSNQNSRNFYKRWLTKTKNVNVPLTPTCEYKPNYLETVFNEGVRADSLCSVLLEVEMWFTYGALNFEASSSITGSF